MEKELSNDAQIIIFHEVLDEINRLFCELYRDYPVVLNHSELPLSLREEALKLYWEREAKVILSAKALIEGYNVPSTDVGIIVASSTSPRQRIQSIGRVMRKYPGKEFSRIYNIYVKDSADEYIFMRSNWDKMLGVQASSYYLWHNDNEIEKLDGPPYDPALKDTEIDENALREGMIYPGEYEGEEFSVDTQENISKIKQDGREKRKLFVKNPQGIGKKVLNVKGEAGTFKVTPERKFVIVRRLDKEGKWRNYYVGKLYEEFQVEESKVTQQLTSYKYSRKFGGAVVRVDEKVERYDNGSAAAKQVVAAVEELRRKRNMPISKIYKDDEGNILVRVQQEFVKICQIESDFQFHQ